MVKWELLLLLLFHIILSNINPKTLHRFHYNVACCFRYLIGQQNLNANPKLKHKPMNEKKYNNNNMKDERINYNFFHLWSCFLNEYFYFIILSPFLEKYFFVICCIITIFKKDFTYTIVKFDF